jgi:hypothetical protein
MTEVLAAIGFVAVIIWLEPYADKLVDSYNRWQRNRNYKPMTEAEHKEFLELVTWMEENNSKKERND